MMQYKGREIKPVKQDYAAAELLEETHPYNIMHQTTQLECPPDLVQARLNLRPATCSLIVDNASMKHKTRAINMIACILQIKSNTFHPLKQSHLSEFKPNTINSFRQPQSVQNMNHMTNCVHQAMSLCRIHGSLCNKLT